MSRPPFSILGLDHVVLRCTRLDDTLAFYRDVLGCPLERVVESVRLYQLRAGDTLIDLVPAGGPLDGDGPAGGDGRNMHHFCLRVARPHWPALIAWLRDRGIPCDEPARRYGAVGFGRSVYVEDPEGNSVELKGPER